MIAIVSQFTLGMLLLVAAYVAVTRGMIVEAVIYALGACLLEGVLILAGMAALKDTRA